MSNPFVGEVQIVGFDFAPVNYAFAAGQLIPIQQNTALFSLIGATYGGNGQTTFALPNLASRQACGFGEAPGSTARTLGETFGTFTTTLTASQMPAHSHQLNAYRPATATALAAVPTATTAIGHSGFGTFDAFAPLGGGGATLAAAAIVSDGIGQPHLNTQPYLGLSYIIALLGTFPQRP